MTQTKTTKFRVPSAGFDEYKHYSYCQGMDDVLEALRRNEVESQGFRFKVREVAPILPRQGPGRILSMVLEGSRKETGELYLMAACENARFPKHRYKPDPTGEWGYRVKLYSFAGILFDVDATATSVFLARGRNVYQHDGDGVHQPFSRFWLGCLHLPGGLELVED